MTVPDETMFGHDELADFLLTKLMLERVAERFNRRFGEGDSYRLLALAAAGMLDDLFGNFTDDDEKKSITTAVIAVIPPDPIEVP